VGDDAMHTLHPHPRKDDMNHRLSLERIQHAATVIPPEFLNTPQYRAESLEPILGCQLIVKLETANPIRSFKGRGSAYFVSQLEAGARIVCASAGNFGQGLAYAVRRRGDVDLTVYASVNANPFKLERMRALGAKVVLAGEDFDAAKLEAKRFAAVTNATMVEDGLIESISEGAGTIGLELARFDGVIDDLVIPLGNGAMLGGVARWFKHARGDTRIVAVQTRGAPAMLESWQAKRVIEHTAIRTIADGIGVRIPIPEAVEDMRDLVDEGLLVRDETILETIKLAHQHLGVVLEPSGAAGLAAILEHRERFSGRSVATILCGGNLTLEQMRLLS
jgi:threonine dehydratase